MRPLNFTADELSNALLANASKANVCVLDSCGVEYLGSHLLIAGVEPIEIHEISNDDPERTLRQFEGYLKKGYAAIFTISYDFGRKLQPHFVTSMARSDEPDIFVALFKVLAVHDYAFGESFLVGTESSFDELERRLIKAARQDISTRVKSIESNFSRGQYVGAIESIKELIRRGDTYQTNLTQQFNAQLPKDLLPESIFAELRRTHPAPFSAFLKRVDSTVVSASPERFFKIEEGVISTSPIKGTQRRGITTVEDAAMIAGLASSEKDRAENIMIVDLLRNDLGRVCEYGSVKVAKLCEIESHPTFHHMVSTINGELRTDVGIANVLRALFPCGSITGAPKIRTMELIDEVENAPRGLSMGAIGFYVPETGFEDLNPGFDLSVAIRTMVIKDGTAVFNVGGGITIDSDAGAEHEESMLKAKAIFAALGNKM